MSNKKLKRLQELAFRHADESMTPQYLAELEALLRDDDDAQRTYLACMSLHSRLALVMGGLGPAATPFDNLVSSANSGLEPSQHATLQSSPKLSLLNMALAACALAASLLAIFAFLPKFNGGDPEFVARVIEKIDCDWESERWVTKTALNIEAGEVVNLNRGLMVIEFGEGAKVTLEGPSQFEITSASRGFLHAGKLTSLVPKQARGFTVGTPSCESVDLGTEFGLRVFGDGTAETHVFDGEVVLKSVQQAGKEPAEPLHLTTDMAARVDGNSHAVSAVAAAPKAFLQVGFEDQHDTPAEPASAISKASQLVLWLDAARHVQTDQQGRVSSWGDMLYGDNVKREDAWQVLPDKRPLLVVDALGGQPAVRFDGSTHLVTTPIATANDVTLFCVFSCRRHDILRNRSAMLINFNGPPNLVVERTWQDDLAGRMYGGWKNGKAVHGSKLRVPDLVEEQPMVIAFRYDYSSNESVFLVDGQWAASGPAAVPAAVKSPKFIGKNRDPQRSGHFVGDIGEILVFNSALSDRDCQRISKHLIKKYALQGDSLTPAETDVVQDSF